YCAKNIADLLSNEFNIIVQEIADKENELQKFKNDSKDKIIDEEFLNRSRAILQKKKFGATKLQIECLAEKIKILHEIQSENITIREHLRQKNLEIQRKYHQANNCANNRVISWKGVDKAAVINKEFELIKTYCPKLSTIDDDNENIDEEIRTIKRLCRPKKSQSKSARLNSISDFDTQLNRLRNLRLISAKASNSARNRTKPTIDDEQQAKVGDASQCEVLLNGGQELFDESSDYSAELERVREED
ncbi:MAG: hypothetical protein MHMPM18_002660, partial [Marteilia pararefringens]